jgi:hypothetical protein
MSQKNAALMERCFLRGIKDLYQTSLIPRKKQRSIKATFSTFFPKFNYVQYIPFSLPYDDKLKLFLNV